MLLTIFEFHEICAGKAALLLQAELKLHLRLYFETAKNALLKSVCYVKEFVICSLVKTKLPYEMCSSQLLCLKALLRDTLAQLSLAAVRSCSVLTLSALCSEDSVCFVNNWGVYRPACCSSV